jgi:CrcB protein
LRNYILAFVGGGIGASARYYLSGAVYRWLPANFPYGNLAVNIIGCFVIGFLMTSLEERFIVTPALRVFLTVGILGGFTTFSSFSYETVSLIRDGEIFLGTINASATLLGCLAATWIGMMTGKLT